MTQLHDFEKAYFEQLKAQVTETRGSHPEMIPGSTVRVSVKVTEGTRERVQVYEGVVIAVRNKMHRSTFVVRKISGDIEVERTFSYYSPRITKIEVVRYGRVRRAKLYYLRGLRGRSARIAERTSGHAAKIKKASMKKA